MAPEPTGGPFNFGANAYDPDGVLPPVGLDAGLTLSDAAWVFVIDHLRAVFSDPERRVAPVQRESDLVLDVDGVVAATALDSASRGQVMRYTQLVRAFLPSPHVVVEVPINGW